MKSPTEEARLAALRAYFGVVVRDLLSRGVIRFQNGQTINSVVTSELETIIREVTYDLGVVLKEMGAGLLQGFASLVSGMLTSRR